MITGKNESKTLTCKCKCRFYEKNICNSEQW